MTALPPALDQALDRLVELSLAREPGPHERNEINRLEATIAAETDAELVQLRSLQQVRAHLEVLRVEKEEAIHEAREQEKETVQDLKRQLTAANL